MNTLPSHPTRPLLRFIPTFGVLLSGIALAGWAHAQSTVSISGWLDIGISRKTGGPTQLGTIGRSNISFSGTEDLGGGLAATFKLSTRFDIDTGTLENSDAQRPFWKDESTVGLKGPFGAIRLGRALTPVWQAAWLYDAWYNFDRIASPQWYAFAPDYLSNPQTREYGRLNNGVFYDSPKFGGFSAHFSAAVDRDPGDLTRGVSGTVRYEDGPISAMVGLERNSQKDRLAFIGASYKFSELQIMGGYSKVKLNRDGAIFGPEWTNWAGASDPKSTRTGLTLSAAYTFGVSTLKVGLGRDRQGATNGFNYIGSTFKNAGTGFSGPITMASLGYSYALSKRTSLFADLSHSRWKYTDDKGHRSATGYALGMSHSF